MRRTRAIALGLGVVLAGALALGVFGWYLPLRRGVDVGAGMLAKQICSCVYIAKRSPEDCRADQFESLDPIRFDALPDARGIRAFVPYLGERTAVYEDGLGCTLQ